MTRRATRCLLPLLAALSFQLVGCSDDTSQTNNALSTVSPSPGATSTAGPAWTLLADEPDGVALLAGDYGLTANGVSGKVAVVRAPEGYMNYGGWTFIAGDPFRAMGVATADRVFPDPCGSKSGSKAAPVDPGPTVEGLAAALVAQKGVTTSTPRPITVDGHRGLYLDYQMSEGIDLRDCGAKAFDIFTTGPGSWYFDGASRERAAIWILDVDGERLVLSWVAVPGVTEEHMREMTEMAESARFVDAA